MDFLKEVFSGGKDSAAMVAARAQHASLPAFPHYETEEADERFLFKTIVLGDVHTGKTSLIKRLVNENFTQRYTATNGVDFYLKVLKWPQRNVSLQFWDVSGRERMGKMTRVYYSDLCGIFVVFDVSRSSTLEAVLQWKSDLERKCNNIENIPIILLANKCDLERPSRMMTQRLDKLCKTDFIAWFETSAKDPNSKGFIQATKLMTNKMISNHVMATEKLSEQKRIKQKRAQRRLQRREQEDDDEEGEYDEELEDLYDSE